jgi:hypothetical protein
MGAQWAFIKLTSRRIRVVAQTDAQRIVMLKQPLGLRLCLLAVDQCCMLVYRILAGTLGRKAALTFL